MATDLIRPDDALLALRAQRSEEGAFAELYARHARYIAGVVFRLMGDDLDLEDVVQETFLTAADALSQLENPAALRPWLVAIAVRRVRRQLSRRRRRKLLARLVAEVSPVVSDPLALSEVDELYDALDRIPADLRIPWALSRIEALSLPEVARACGRSLSTVKRRIAEADERLERRLGQ